MALVVLLGALFAATIEVHSGSHPEVIPGTVSVDLSATHAAETGHIEAAGARADLLCPACLVLLQTIASPREDSVQGDAPREAAASGGDQATPLRTGLASSVSSRAPPLTAV